MKKKRLIVNLLKAPLALLIVISFIASIYAAATNLQGITFGTPIFFGIILILYGVGLWYEKKKKESFTPNSHQGKSVKK
jgi:hypothetical protein